jgi:hypothetical protein
MRSLEDAQEKILLTSVCMVLHAEFVEQYYLHHGI